MDCRETTLQERIETSWRQVQRALGRACGARQNSIPTLLRASDRPVCWLRWVMDGSMEDAGKAVGRPGDEGIDGIIKEDRLSLDVI